MADVENMAESIASSTKRRMAGVCFLLLTALLLNPVCSEASGTAAGTLIPNTASMQFAIDGLSKNVRSNTTESRVDEVLDVVVAAEQAEAVAIDSPMETAVVSFLATNTGNGVEGYRLFLDLNINEGGFDPSSGGLWLETNGVPGLQTGAGGDSVHVDGAVVNLIADQNITVHAAVVIPGALAAYAESLIRLRAVSATINAASGVNDPDAAEFPPPGSTFTAAGDGGTYAVVGSTHQAEQPVFFAFPGFRIDAPTVALDKVAVAVRAADGTDAVRPGSIVDYRMRVEVRDAGSLSGMRLKDLLPPELEYIAGSLAINGTVEDDDLEPLGTDVGGYDPHTATLDVGLGDVALADAAGTAVHVVTFSATIR